MDLGRNNGIAVAGTVLVDKINEIARYPQSGELTKILKVNKSPGGCVPNVAIDLKKISPELRISAIGKIGDDENGEFVIKALKDSGVDNINLSVIKNEATSFTDVMSIEGGQRTFFTYSGASSYFGEEDVDFNAIDPKILHLGYFLLLEKTDNGDGLKILKKAQAKGIKTSIDLVSENSDRYSLVLPCLRFTDFLIINELEAGKLTGIEPVEKNLEKIAKKLKSAGVREKVIIHFKDGAVCCSDNGFSYLGSYILPKNFIAGTTGAGDAFCAGALIGIYNGFSDIKILEFASMCAAMALRTADATGGIAGEKETVEICKKFKRVKLCL